MNEKSIRQDRLRSQPAARRPAAEKAFSMIELLLIVAIISLLTTIAVPSLGKAKDLARRAVCMANLRRLAVAANTYTVKFDNYMPPHRMPYNFDGSVYKYKGTYQSKYRREKPRWQWFLEEGAGPVINPSEFSNESEFQAATEMTNNYFLCPSLRDEYAKDIRHGAYGYNHAYLGSGRPKVKTASKYVPMNWPVRINRVYDTSRTVMFGDSRGAVDGPNMDVRQHAYTLDSPRMAVSLGFTEFGPKNDIDSRVDSDYMHSPAHERHLGSANIAFADAHAQSMSLEGLGYVLDDNGLVAMDDADGDNELWTGREDNTP